MPMADFPSIDTSCSTFQFSSTHRAAYSAESGFLSDSWEGNKTHEKEVVGHQHQQSQHQQNNKSRSIKHYNTFSPSSVDTDILLGACDRLLDNIDAKLEPLTRVPLEEQYRNQPLNLSVACNYRVTEETEEDDQTMEQQGASDYDEEQVEIEPPSDEICDNGQVLEEEFDEVEEIVEDSPPPPSISAKPPKPPTKAKRATTGRSATIKIIPSSSVSLKGHKVTSGKGNSSLVVVGSHPRHGTTRGHVKSGQAWRRHTVGGTVVHKKEHATKHSSTSSTSSASQQKQQHRKIQPSHVTYIPIEGTNLPVCVYKVQNVDSSEGSTNGSSGAEAGGQNNHQPSKHQLGKLAKARMQSNKVVKPTSGVPNASLDEWERNQIEKLKHNIEKMTTKYFAGVPLSSSFKDIPLDSDLETVRSSVVNEKFNHAYKTARERNGSPPVISAGEPCSDDEFIIAKPPSRARTLTTPVVKSQSSRHINEMARSVSRRSNNDRYVEDVRALRDDIWHLSEQRTKTMNEVAELSEHLKNVLEELQGTQFQVDEYSARMEAMRRDCEDTERKKERMYQELLVLQNEVQQKQQEQSAIQKQEQQEQMQMQQKQQNEEIERMVEAQMEKMLSKTEELHAKERQILEDKIAQLESEVVKSASKSRSSSPVKVSFKKESDEDADAEQERIREEENEKEIKIKEKMDQLEKELGFLKAKLEEAVLDKEAASEKRRQLEEKIKRLENERDNLLELFLRNDRLPSEYAVQAVELARRYFKETEQQQFVKNSGDMNTQTMMLAVDAALSPLPTFESPQPQQQNQVEMMTQLQQQLVDTIEQKMANAKADNEEIRRQMFVKEDEIENLQAKIKSMEEQHKKQVDNLVSTIENERRERLEESQHDIEHYQRELSDSNRRNEQLSQQVVLLQQQIELDREQTRLAIEEKQIMLEQVKDDKVRDIDRIRQQMEEERQFDIEGLEGQITKLRQDLHQLETEKQRDLDLFANGLVNFDKLETSFVNDINDECRKIASLMEVTPRRVKLMSFRLERSSGNPAAQFNTILSSSSSPVVSAMGNLQITCQELRELCLRQRAEIEDRKDSMKKAEQDKIDEIDQLRCKMLQEKQEELSSLKESFLKGQRNEQERLRAEAKQMANIQAELKQKDSELKEIEAHMTTWKEETIDKLTNKLTLKFVEEMEKAAKNQVKFAKELERRLSDRTRELERAQREVAFMRQLRNITDSTMAARACYRDTPIDVNKKFDDFPTPSESVNNLISTPNIVNNLRESLKATAADCMYSENSAALKRRAVRLQQHPGVSKLEINNNSTAITNINNNIAKKSVASSSTSSICIAAFVDKRHHSPCPSTPSCTLALLNSSQNSSTKIALNNNNNSNNNSNSNSTNGRSSLNVPEKVSQKEKAERDACRKQARSGIKKDDEHIMTILGTVAQLRADECPSSIKSVSSVSLMREMSPPTTSSSSTSSTVGNNNDKESNKQMSNSSRTEDLEAAKAAICTAINKRLVTA